MAPGPLLIAKGRVLTPRSRLRYRVRRVRGVERSGDELSLATLAIRILSLPLLTAADVVAWPVLRRTVRSSSWWVVELRFHGDDAELVRVAEAASREMAEARRSELLAARARAR